jgi:hypothetical protein
MSKNKSWGKLKLKYLKHHNFTKNQLYEMTAFELKMEKIRIF